MNNVAGTAIAAVILALAVYGMVVLLRTGC